ncbi:MAG: hypothetical protein Q9166_005971 [cf. Caloplaca sp. 2 TL-2023]
MNTNPGAYTIDFCCGAAEGSNEAKAGCCDTTNLTFAATGGTGPFFSPDDNRIAPAVASDSTDASLVSQTMIRTTTSLSMDAAANLATQPAAVSPDPSPGSTSSKRDVAIGLGVHVPIPVLSLLAVVVSLVREQRRRKHAEKMSEKLRVAKDLSGWSHVSGS